MRKHIIVTLILLMVIAYVTVVYFKNLNPPGTRNSLVMRSIPDNASLIFGFNNDESFYDIFRGNKLFRAVTGNQVLGELDTLRQQVLQNPILNKYFTGQNLFISVHPSASKKIELLFTISATKGFGPSVFDELAKHPESGLLVTPMRTAGKPGFNIYINALKKRFYVIIKDNNILSGSFSKDLADLCATYQAKKNKQSFVLLPARQNVNSLANIYVNYGQFTPLFDLIFKNRNTDIFKSFRLLPGFAALSLNYKTDALMFSGETSTPATEAPVYLNLFANQQPVVNHLKDIFPSTTAYATNFSTTDPLRFGRDLSDQHINAGLKTEKEELFNKIQAETGINLSADFYKLLGNEFAIVTTRYFEKFAIIAVKNGSEMNLLLTSISKITDVNSGQFNYDKLPYFLLGDAFGLFKHPYYLIIDNYLILANSAGELKSYYDTYINRKFLSKNQQYEQFENLLAAQSNVAFLLIFKNAAQTFKRDMDDEFYNKFQTNEPGWENFYGASWQLSAADKNFYTNFCLMLNADTTTAKN